ncbi:hypothetical protein [Streptomyces sp. NPDC052015]|uniref:hypothetical protein n=1 Tax=Streptomyces sp. NPDC052015 TaxID=3154755 RepID=UPI0034353A13
MTDDFDRREEICPDCQATEGDRDTRVRMAGQDPETGRLFVTITYHHNTCPAYTVEQILMEDSARRLKEKDAWAKEAFPDAHARLLQAVMRGAPFSDDVHPFVAALVELVEAQAENVDRFVTLDRWAEILEEHFPPAGKLPVCPDEEPT